MSAAYNRGMKFGLARCTDQELRDELDKRARALGKPPHQWDEKRTEYLKRLIAEFQAALDGAQEDRIPGGSAYARRRSLREKIKKYEAWLVLAEADEKKAGEARKRP
ncbi:hypothetical protein D3C81_315320 [compost metagenome]